MAKAVTKKQAIHKAIDSTACIGSHRHTIFEEVLKKNGYKIVKVKK